jgi:hypothetical protein
LKVHDLHASAANLTRTTQASGELLYQIKGSWLRGEDSSLGLQL